jgi:hypothetical protein
VATDWEQMFRNWSKPSSDDECEKQENAERIVGDAIRASDSLKTRTIKIIPQGSYRNNTNVRQESDVDICVCCMEPFFDDYEFADYNRAESGVVAASYTYAQFKNEVQLALETRFGRAGVARGDKAFDVHANSYRVDADVVPAFACRLYTKKEFNFGHLPSYLTPEGTRFISDSNSIITNWPEQHYANGVAKNKRTGGRFKLIVRAVKRLKFYLIDKGVDRCDPVPSYLIECLLYNVPDTTFAADSYKDIVQNALLGCFTATKPDGNYANWLEVNEIKYLFRDYQPWSRQQAYDFVLAAWYYVEKN